ncbi:hypothetical protein MPH47_17715 [Psychrobacillus psychrodurans]|uniref:hypothetical protein n=1 Tax=Psychrobacillus psychrodurans TaxID=126157 RepID=UPI001F4D42C2|nr:hypothetical protein [Psychrobacillus psychrodurans]MCK1999038.1 hypothetical protein [Psychrobacillus psychrodurans]
MKGLSISTSLVAAIVTTILFKFLDYFHFIKWDPIGYTKTFQFLKGSNVYVKWLILFLVIWGICFLLYYVCLLFAKIPVSITSIALGLLIAIALEWIILDADSIEKTIKKLSIPFICIVIVAVRFIMESAIFHSQDTPLGK